MILLEEVETWYFTLDEDAIVAVTGAIDLLELEGPSVARRWTKSRDRSFTA